MWTFLSTNTTPSLSELNSLIALIWFNVGYVFLSHSRSYSLHHNCHIEYVLHNARKENASTVHTTAPYTEKVSINYHRMALTPNLIYQLLYSCMKEGIYLCHLSLTDSRTGWNPWTGHVVCVYVSFTGVSRSAIPLSHSFSLNTRQLPNNRKSITKVNRTKDIH